MQATDPVCGMTVDPDHAKYVHVHDAVRYAFCSASCRERFSGDPAAFLKRAGPGPDKHPVASVYTCPMHPDVRQEGPGSCPICGMALEPLVPVRAQPHGEGGAAGTKEANAELHDMSRRALIASVLTAPLLAVAMGDMLPGGLLAGLGSPRDLQWIEAALATPVVLWAGWPFLVRAARSVVPAPWPRLNMFTLIGLGVLSAWLLSMAAVLAPDVFPPTFRDHSGVVPVYFEAAAVIVTLVLLGQVLELRARRATGAAIRALLDLAPRTARRVSGSDEQDVPLDEVVPGDSLRVRPGESVPVDGVLLTGTGVLDESMVTGESMPVEKQAGDKLVGGTSNSQGSFVMRAEKVGAETLLSRIVAQVAQAQRSRAPIQGLADRMAAWFVPVVIAIAVLTFGIWWSTGPEPRLAHAVINAVAVLVIACPCALGLATPMSIMVAMGRGAHAGVLFRDAEALERLRDVDTLVVDKTGTLTEGKPRLVAVEPVGAWADASRADELLSLAASLERGSEHPLAAAIVKGAQERGLSLQPTGDFRSLTGKGITGRVGGRTVALGNAALFAELHVDVATLEPRAEDMRRQGRTAMLVAVDGVAAGCLAVADPVKASTPQAIRELRADGLRIVLLSGDAQATAEAVARELGIDEVFAGVLPEQKLERIRALQQQGRRVAMAGDGVNDAPALAQADVGIAMGTGTDAAIESAAVTLLKGDLLGIDRARRLSRVAVRNIRQNLGFAFLYNVVGVPIAAGVLYPFTGTLMSPMLAAAAMSLSSVSVIGNALRLRRFKLS